MPSGSAAVRSNRAGTWPAFAPRFQAKERCLRCDPGHPTRSAPKLTSQGEKLGKGVMLRVLGLAMAMAAVGMMIAIYVNGL